MSRVTGEGSVPQSIGSGTKVFPSSKASRPGPQQVKRAAVRRDPLHRPDLHRVGQHLGEVLHHHRRVGGQVTAGGPDVDELPALESENVLPRGGMNLTQMDTEIVNGRSSTRSQVSPAKR